jgi:hypothetical protein
MNKTYKKTNRGGKIAIFENLPEMPGGDQICAFSQNPNFIVGDYYLSVSDDLDLEPRDYLLLFPTPYGELAYKNFDEEHYKVNKYNRPINQRDALMASFDWEASPQGFYFWYDVYDGKFPEIKKQTENKEMTEEKQNIQTKITPAFAQFIKSHPKAVINATCSNYDTAILYVNQTPGEANINFFNGGFVKYKNVSNGEFIDALDALPEIKKEKTLSFEVLGHYPIVGENVKIGCQTFELESCKKFAAEYEEWKSGPANWNEKSFYTDSSDELRALVLSLRPDLCSYRSSRSTLYPKLVFDDSYFESTPIGGNYHGCGHKISIGQFIDKVMNLKKERKQKMINIRNIEVSLSESGGMTVYGLIPHEIIEKLIKETA